MGYGSSARYIERQSFSAMVPPRDIVNQNENRGKEALPCFQHIVHLPRTSIQSVHPFRAQRLDNQMCNFFENEENPQPFTTVQMATVSLYRYQKIE